MSKDVLVIPMWCAELRCVSCLQTKAKIAVWELLVCNIYRCESENMSIFLWWIINI